MPLSAYVLTFNSARHLDGVLRQLDKVADELIVLDSGSKDESLTIARRYTEQIHHRKFDDFIRQREHAASLCRHEWILFVDSDEYLDDALVAEINFLKQQALQAHDCEAYVLRRYWYVLGRPVHSIYPIKSPDYRIRLYNQNKGHFDSNNPVHEKLIGFSKIGRIETGAIHHYTFETREEFVLKLDRYMDLAVQGMQHRGKHTSRTKAYVHAVAAFLKSYFSYQGWRDGGVGLLCARYAYNYTLRKYMRLLELQRQ